MTLGCPRPPQSDRARPHLAPVLTDLHFWIPVVVLAAGTCLLLAMS